MGNCYKYTSNFFRFPGVTEVQAEHASGDSEINIDEMVDKIKRGISDTFDISLD